MRKIRERRKRGFCMRIDRKKVLTLFALTLLIAPLLLVNVDVGTSDGVPGPMYLHGPSLTPTHMHSNESLVPVHMNSNKTLTPVHMHFIGPPGQDPIRYPKYTYWHELYPKYCQEWYLTSWIDNGDEVLSPNDQIDMMDMLERVTYYHVDRITWTLNLSNLQDPTQRMFVEFKGPPQIVDPINYPVCTYWHEVYPNYFKVYHIVGIDPQPPLERCKTIWLDDISTPVIDPIPWHVDDVATDLILREKIMDPICTWWHQIYPQYCKWSHLTSWEDTGAPIGQLSPSDQIDMDSDAWYWDKFHSMGDVNRDGYINKTDLDRIAAKFGWTGPPGGIPEDIDKDGDVDNDDLYTCGLNQGENIWTTFPGLGKKEWYHVDRVTLTLNVTLEREPSKWMKIELKTSYFEEMYEALKRPVVTRWHEVYPRYSNVYELVGWDWMEDDNCNGVLDVCDYIWLYNVTGQVEPERYHVEDICYDIILNKKIMDPRCTYWHELYPKYCEMWHLTSWHESLEDPYPGRLSPSDQIDMNNTRTGEIKWYHVDRVTLTLNVSTPGGPYLIEYKGPFEGMYGVKTAPINTTWHVVYPYYSEIMTIQDWQDNCNGVLDRCDFIQLWGAWCHVEDIAIDIILNEKIANPVCTYWHELYPIFSNRYHVERWTDNGDGLLSPCDKIDLKLQPEGPTREYHVENVTLTLNLTADGVNYYLYEFIGPIDMYQAKTKPICTLWRMVWPVIGEIDEHLIDWQDNCNGVLDRCDYILFGKTWFHVEDIAIDIIVKLLVHDVAVTAVSSLYPWVYQGEVDPISVTIKNLGDYNEPTVDVYAYYDGNLAAPKQTTSLNIGQTKTLTFNWDTTSVSPGVYTISAKAIIPLDDIPGNNQLTDGTQEVRQRPPRHDALAVWQHYNKSYNDWDIWYSIYTDPHVWWTIGGPTTDPIVKDSLPPGPALLLPGDDMEPAVSWYVDKYAIAVWQHQASSGAQWDIWYSQYQPGVGWTWPAPVWVSAVDDLDPAIAIDDNGWGIVVWRHGTPAVGYVLYYSVWNPFLPGWIGPNNVISGIWPPGCNQARTPEICIDSLHNAITVFTDNPIGGIGTEQILYSWVNFVAPPPPPMTWTVPAVIPGCPVMPPGWDWQKGISPDWLGNAITVWGLVAPIPPEPIAFAQFTSPPKVWTIPANPLPATNGEHPDVAFDRLNNAIAVYTHWPTGQIWYSIWNGAAWTPGMFAAWAGTGIEQWPAIAFLSNNKAVMVWQAYPEPGPKGEIYYSVYTPPHVGLWSPAATVNSPGLLLGDDAYVDIAAPNGSPTIPPHIHDVAVKNVSVCHGATFVHGGQMCCINVTVVNEGDFTETFNVTVYWNTTEIQTKLFTLASGTRNSTCFSWNTTGLTEYRYYNMTAYAHPVPGEADLADNTCIYGLVQIVHVGDVNADKIVDITDVYLCALAFGAIHDTDSASPTYCQYWHPTPCPQCPHSPNLDINCDGIIDISDIYLAAINFGWMPP